MVFRNVDTKKISGLKIPALIEDGIELPKKARMGAWYGLNLINFAQPLLIVESEICAMFAYQCGFTNVISPGGMGPTKAQIRSIPNRNIYLGFDSDNPGKVGARQFRNRISNRAEVLYADWGLVGRKDPGEMKNIKEFKYVMNNLKEEL